MWRDIYEIKPTGVENILEDLRNMIGTKMGAGVTLTGNRLTIRWTPKMSKKMVQVHMVILEVDDGEREPEEEDK